MAGEQFISLDEMFQILERKDGTGEPVPFTIEFTTYDAARKKKPSRHIKVNRAVKAGANHDLVRHRHFAIQPLDPGHPERISIHIRAVDKINGMIPL